MIHPEAMPQDVEAFLSCVGYANTADDPIEIRHTLLGEHDLVADSCLHLTILL